MSLHAMPDLARGFSIVLDHLGFEVLHNKTDVSLLTSDNPVVCFDPTVPEGGVLPYQVRPPHGSIELLFPTTQKRFCVATQGYAAQGREA